MHNALREALAALAHAQWSGWMEYLFEQSQVNTDGTVTIPAWAAARWQRQMTTPYAALAAEEQESDRSEADRVVAVIAAHAHD